MSADAPEWLEVVLADVRRQGRAAIAAQAAAEACEERVAELGAALERSRDRAPDPDAPTVESFVRSILPFSDALDRVVDQARRLDTTAARRGWGGLRRLLPVANDEAERLRMMREAVELLRHQLDQVFESHGVELERGLGGLLDTSIHRVVETRSGAPQGRVVGVVRAGARAWGRVLREADVVTGESWADASD
jgi:molecular chaperone GrpE (heat shock protein)